jgi:hypothetical protein
LKLPAERLFRIDEGQGDGNLPESRLATLAEACVDQARRQRRGCAGEGEHMKAGRAIAAGLVGGVAMTVLAWLVRQTGLQMNAEMMLGSILSSSPRLTTWLIGFVMHLVISALIALIYAWGFERVTHRAGAVVGLGFGVIHVVIAGVVMAMIPAIHPMIPESMPAPGAFMANMGGTFVALFVIEHLLYGAIVGGMYGPVEHPATGRPVAAADARRA